MANCKPDLPQFFHTGCSRLKYPGSASHKSPPMKAESSKLCSCWLPLTAHREGQSWRVEGEQKVNAGSWGHNGGKKGKAKKGGHCKMKHYFIQSLSIRQWKGRNYQKTIGSDLVLAASRALDQWQTPSGYGSAAVKSSTMTAQRERAQVSTAKVWQSGEKKPQTHTTYPSEFQQRSCLKEISYFPWGK